MMEKKRKELDAKLVPNEPSFAQFVGCMKGEIEISGDILSTGVVWEAENHEHRQPHDCRD